MKHLLSKQAKRAFAIGMAAIGLGLTGCSLLPPFPDHIQNFDSGEKATIYEYKDYFFIKSEFKDYPTSCSALYSRDQTDLEDILSVLSNVVARHDVKNNCGKFRFSPDGEFVLREHDLFLGFEKSKTETVCSVSVGFEKSKSAPKSAAEAQALEEIARQFFPDCNRIRTIDLKAKSKKGEAE
ncbi:hypothetical protein [Salinimonas chungwhensis]|uniref:hypothetical protein n=1 Tax=Salinimonas chungwhensis TaxID=265425 RepID=UPI0003755B2E|nr:hypothetical protein [Salinimonas chungwhensis]